MGKQDTQIYNIIVEIRNDIRQKILNLYSETFYGDKGI